MTSKLNSFQPWAWFQKYCINGGVSSTDSVARARAIRISNIIALSAIVNTLIFGVLFFIRNDESIFQTCLWISAIYATAQFTGVLFNITLGRYLVLISGNVIVFYFACLYRGEASIQLLFYSLSITPFMHFSWEERKHYLLGFLPVVLLMFGEYHDWSYFHAHAVDYDLKLVRVFAVVAPLIQILIGFFYFLKQSVKFEAESNANLEQIEIEHRKQIQVQKMSSLGEMAGGISHEINNPLMVIIGKTYNLRRELKQKLSEDDTAFANLDKIDSMVHRIARIIRSLRSFSRNSENDPTENIELSIILESTLDLCRERFASAGIKLDLNIEEKIELICRPTEITQILLNLLNNAYDASTLTADSMVTIHVKRKDSHVEILVEDNGIGIPEHIEEKIMQPFFSTKEIGRGTGLGLSISKGLVESHNGTLTFLSGRPVTTFQILLPVQTD